MASFTVDLSRVFDGLERDKKNAEKVVKRTIGDMRTRAPGWVSKAVRQEYNISAKEVKSAMHTENAGKTSVAGVEVDNVTLVYRGRVLTPTHFKMRPKARPARVPYQISMEVKKGEREVLHGKPDYAGAPFLAKANGSPEIPFQRENKERNDKGQPLPIHSNKTVSIPQMIANRDGPKPEVEKAINEGLEKRFEHYSKLYLG